MITDEKLLEELRDRFYAERNRDLIGIRDDLSNTEYHQSPGLSNSGCGLLSKSPYHLLSKPTLESDSLTLGTGVHAATLEPTVWEECFIRADESLHPNSNEFKRLKLDAESKGFVYMKAELYDKVWDIVEGIYRNPIASQLLSQPGALAERSVFQPSKYHDILLKVRPDLWVPSADIIVDLKTTKCAAISGNDTFAKSCGRYRYDRQAAMYKAVMEQATGNTHEFFFVAVETEPPYACVVYQMSEEDEKIGHKDFMANVYDLTQFLKDPRSFAASGYSDSVEQIQIPKYFRRLELAMTNDDGTKYEQNHMGIWDQVCKTNPEITKRVSQRGGFTAIDAQSQLKRATELWGPYGARWGINAVSFEVFSGGADNQPLWVVCNGWFTYPGGEFPIAADAPFDPKNDLSKKLLTECTSKALSKLGFNSDVFEGKFDDNKYLEQVKREFEAKKQWDRFAAKLNEVMAQNPDVIGEGFDSIMAEFGVESTAEIEDVVQQARFLKAIKEYKKPETNKAKAKKAEPKGEANA